MTLDIGKLVSRNCQGDQFQQNLAYLWWPLHVNFGRSRYAWLRLPGPDYHFLSFGLEPEHDERLVAQCGPFRVTRAESLQEQAEREEAWAEDAFMERELNRYTEWYY
jgi:hypothetical protein